MWNDDDILVTIPAPHEYQAEICHPFFDTDLLEFFHDEVSNNGNEYEVLIRKYISGKLSSIQDISLYTADALMSSIKNEDIFFYTPIVIYIIRKVLKMN
jgi:hypothetical protein